MEPEDKCPAHDDSVEYESDKSAGEACEKAVMQCLLAEETRGGADDAMLCLKRNVSWGLFEDYDDAIPRIVAAEARRAGHGGYETPALQGEDAKPHQSNKLRVMARLAESDAMTGKQGKEWFDELWKKHCGSGDVVEYESQTVTGSDHDSITDVRFGVLDSFYAEVRRSWRA